MKLKLIHIRKAIVFITLMLLATGGGYWLGTHEIKVKSQKLKVQSIEIVDRAEPAIQNIDFGLFWQVWQKLEEKYFDKSKLDRQKMFFGAIQGLTASLGDPYTVFLPPVDNQQAKEDLNGSFEGVGIQLGFDKDNRLSVMTPLKGSPAEAGGVRAGDLILRIKDNNKKIDEDTLGITLPQAVEKIRGPKGSTVILTLRHEKEDKDYTVELKRDTIVVPSVEVNFLKDESIAQLKLTRFGDLTDDQWNKAVDQILESPKTKGLILDVRGNPGGYLKGSVNLASEFLEKGIIVKQENYKGEVDTYSVNRRGRLLTIPMIVLIDKGSASASEILAGALKDHGRAKLVGTTSFGKGTIQETEEFEGGAGIHITTAKWLTPNGTWVDKTGLKPDIEIENDPNNLKEDKQLDKAVEILSNK